jgi:hypothetical protein
MDIALLATTTGIRSRKLRYVLDHEILPGSRQHSSGHGVVRSFTAFEGFCIAVAARMLAAGCTPRLTSKTFDKAQILVGEPPTNCLLAAYTAKNAVIEIADGIAVRVRGERSPGVTRAFDTGWIPLDVRLTFLALDNPQIIVTVRLQALSEMIRRTDAKG